MATAPAEKLPEQTLVAPLEKWFTICPQDWFILVTRGGELVDVIHRIKGWTTDENFKFIRGNRHDKVVSPIQAAAQLFNNSNFVGFPIFGYGIYQYKFIWSKYQIREAGGIHHGVSMHDPEILWATPFESQYAFTFNEVDVLVKDRTDDTRNAIMPISIPITFRIRIIEPRIALMTNRGDWFGGGLIPRLEKELALFVGRYTYEDLVQKGKETVANQFFEHIMGENTAQSTEVDVPVSLFRQRLLRDLGVDLVDIGISNPDPNDQYEQANAALIKAEKDAEARRVSADAGLYEDQKVAAGIIAIAAADEERIEKTVLKIAGGPGVSAVQAHKWDKIPGSGLTVYNEAGSGFGGGVGVITPIPSQPEPREPRTPKSRRDRQQKRTQTPQPANPPASQPAPPANP